MPALSKQQQKLFGLALAVKRGDVPKSDVSDEIKGIVKTMSEKDIEKFASTKHKGLPEKKKIKEQLSYHHFIKRAKQSSERMKSNKEKSREMAAASAYQDKKGKGIKFYDKKGAGRIKGGKKVYD